MDPEAQARRNIDRQLVAAGWVIQDAKAIDLSAGLGIAVREFPLTGGFADYLLYVDEKIAGVIEAKPEGHALIGVELQSGKYLAGVPKRLPAWASPLPFAYESTGVETRFTSTLDAVPRSREVFTFHRPDELLRLLRLGPAGQVRTRLASLPPLVPTRLWAPQIEAIENLEKSLAEGRPRALIQMATGSGKTFTACSFCYRLLRHAGAKRILFLVDRNNLGKQTESEFQNYQSPENQYKFTEEYPVQRLSGSAGVAGASKVVISTIQRLYATLRGEELDDEADEGSLFESGDATLRKEPMPVDYKPGFPIETFDFVVIDECHRSIYNLWRQVLDYFDAFLIGLTATPTDQTLGFFHRNLVQDYSHARAVADGVNVGYDVYRIETQITQQGAKLAKEPGVMVPHRSRLTREKRYKELENDVTYTANQVGKDVISGDQLRLVIKTFRDRLPTEIFPGRTEVPKTLVFAKTDNHAEELVDVIRQEFGKGNEFCQKITSKSHRSPDDLLAEFRTAYFPRIAVTVDMIATGTDVKPLECLLFMRSVGSGPYFEQMKGRGCRVVDPAELKQVTSDAVIKDRFVIVDAVGVCERDKTESCPLDRKPTVGLDKVLDLAGKGVADADLASALAAKLTRLDRKLTPEQRQTIEQAAGGQSIASLAADLLSAADADAAAQQAATDHALASAEEATEEQIAAAESDRAREALRPFRKTELRDAILATSRVADIVYDEQNLDALLGAGFDAAARAKAEGQLADFRQYLEENRDRLEALQILYSKPYRAGLRLRHVKELREQLRAALKLAEPVPQLWRLFEAVEPDRVARREGDAVVDLVALVRHALDRASPLVPVRQTIHQRYDAWLAQCAAGGRVFTADQRRWLDAIRDHVAESLTIAPDDLEYVPFNAMGGLGAAHRLFGPQLPEILAELNTALAA
ncbi:type I restriction endonuclease subunit R [Botrimarina mediterranea]|uniref:Type-1 restriction enzyme R protein n=1 Tax=Botrimarina mediterranea TaxID=2528022 RepID=A0A518KD18_9BACT|nr:DEAD/DEAH box helicase family protein [Botrimarina mediterranea]QDV75703.1 Type-1 restriction enzyme R protein [Botrimarina mediterranea]